MPGLFNNDGQILIGKVSDASLSGVTDIRADRKTVLGNPFPMRETGSREKSCRMYEKYARKSYDTHPVYKSKIRELARLVMAGESIRLLCHCHPKQCHTWTVRDLIKLEITCLRKTKRKRSKPATVSSP